MKKILHFLTVLIFTTGFAQNAPITFEPGEFGNAWTWTVFENDDNPPLEIVTNPDPSGINTSATVAKFTARDAGQPFAGVESMHGSDIGTFDLTNDNAIVNIMVWKTKISDVGIKYVTPSSGAQMEIKVANTLINQWELITINFSSYIGLPETTGLDQIVIFPDFVDRDADDIIYFDNISFGPFTPGNVGLPVDFEGTSYNILGFEGADSAIESNPDMSGINTSETVVRTTKTVGAQFFAGTTLTLDIPIDFSITEMISIKTWSPKANIPVRLKLENDDASQFVELDVNTTVENQWEELTWDFTGTTSGLTLTKVILFFEFVVDLPGDGSTYYYDDIEVAGTLGINDVEMNEISAFPNPVSNYWNLSSVVPIQQIEIYNSYGQLVYKIQSERMDLSLDLSTLQTGVYLAKISSLNGTVTKRIIKQ